MRIARPHAQPVIQNVHVSTMAATDDPSRTTQTTVFVPFVERAKDPYGGHVTSIGYRDGKATGIGIRSYLKSDAERAAAGALLDAIHGSGLLELELPANDWQRPAVGRTRIYVDRRARFLEFDTAAPPPVAQAVLDALAAYQRIAARSIAA
jgi:hypothetical protein